MERIGGELHYHDPHGVLVGQGDVLGLYVSPSADPISVVYYQSSLREDVLHYMEGVGYPYCRLSVCNESMTMVYNASPIVQMHSKFIDTCVQSHGSDLGFWKGGGLN